MGQVISFPTMRSITADWQGFYSMPEVSRLARVPTRTLYHWREARFLVPSVRIGDDYGYSYADLTLVRLFRELREHRLDLESASIALAHMYERLGAPGPGWVHAKVYFIGKRIYIDRPDEWEITEATRYGQKVEHRTFGDLFENLRLQELENGASVVVPPKYRPFVTIDPKVMDGEPVVKGTRIPTAFLASMVRKGRTIASLLKRYRNLTKQIITAVVEYEGYLDDRMGNAKARTALA